MSQIKTVIAILEEKRILFRFGPVILVLLVGLFPISWFRDGLPISFYDEDIPLPPFYDLESYSSAWYGRSAPGFFSGRILAKLLFTSYFVLLNKLGIPLPALQAVYIAGCTLLAGFSMYCLFRLLFKTDFSRVGAMIAALLYMNNPVLYHVLWHYMMISLYPAYAVTPLLIVLYIKGLQSDHILKYSAVVAALLLLISPLGAGVPYATPLVIIFMSSIIFYIVISDFWRGTLINSLKFLAVTGALSLLLQSWWVLPLGSTLQSAFGVSESFRSVIGSSSLDTLLINSKSTSFVNLFQMQGFYASYVNDVNGVPWSSYHPMYFEPLVISLGFVVPILAALGILYTRAGIWRGYFGCLWIFSLLVLGGAHPPFGEIYSWLWKNFNYMAVYRGFYAKLGFLLPFTSSVLAGLGVMHMLYILLKLVGRINIRISRTLVAIIVVSIMTIILCIWTFPFWTGEIIAHPNQVKAGAYIKVPTYYSDADVWLQQQGQDFRIMTLPLSKLHYAAYKWDKGFWGMEPSQWLFSAPTIGRITTFQSYTIPLHIAELVNGGEPSNVACLLGLLNVRYLMLHGDTNWEYVRNSEWWVTQHDTSEILLRESLSQQPDLQLAATIGQLYLYENAQVLPHTYIARQLLFLDGGLDELVSDYNTCDVNYPPAIFLSELDSIPASMLPDIEQAKMNLNDLPTITTNKISANHYMIHVENAKAPFVLVFNESYDPDWSAKVLNQIIPSHFPVNGYANAWYIEQKGSFDISIIFTKQRLVEFGFLLSGLGAFLTVAVFVMGLRRYL